MTFGTSLPPRGRLPGRHPTLLRVSGEVTCFRGANFACPAAYGRWQRDDERNGAFGLVMLKRREVLNEVGL